MRRHCKESGGSIMGILFDVLTSLPVIIDNTANGIAGMSEITDFAMLVNVDSVVTCSFHSVMAQKGQYINGTIVQNQPIPQGLSALWCFQAENKAIWSFGKYFTYTTQAEKTTINFWIGLWIQKSNTDIYLWFGKQPPASIQQHLQQVFIPIVDKYGYWYKLKGQNPVANLSACLEGIFSPVNDAVAEVVTEDILRKDISDTVKELLEAVKNASEIGGL
jgi:hypothetical protein